jgi:hypothetical protein
VNWEAISAVGELLSAFAVLITLIYLATQVRQSNRMEAARHWDTHMDRVRENFLAIAQSPDMARIWRVGSEGGSLDADEITRWEAMADHRILIQRDAWRRQIIIGRLPGLTGAAVYLDILAAGLRDNPKFLSYYQSSKRRVFWGEDFTEGIDRKLAESSQRDSSN